MEQKQAPEITAFVATNPQLPVKVDIRLLQHNKKGEMLALRLRHQQREKIVNEKRAQLSKAPSIISG